jgi:hypothetical protein
LPNQGLSKKGVFNLSPNLLDFTQNLTPYNRESAVSYALKWALSPNPAFYDFSQLGGDCTNFASQVILAGGGVMNFNQTNGWYYIDANRKSPSWTGVNFLHDFLVSNRERGPWAEEVDAKKIQTGDIIQLSFQSDGVFQHSLVITGATSPLSLNRIYVSTHTPNAKNIKLTTEYSWERIRFIHILGVNRHL